MVCKFELHSDTMLYRVSSEGKKTHVKSSTVHLMEVRSNGLNRLKHYNYAYLNQIGII